MKLQHQAFRHNPPETYGDCHRTALACLLDLERDDLPNFGEYYGDGVAFNAAVDAYLASVGLREFTVAWNNLDDAHLSMKNANPGVYYLIAGRSPRGFSHTAIGLDGEIVWDPFPAPGPALVGPCDDGLVWISVLVPLAHTARARTKLEVPDA
jgi:hypothetical protein